jgi:hypothetical protein
MSLNWNIGKVKDYTNTCYERLPLEGNEDRLKDGGFMGPYWYVSKDDPNTIERLTVTTQTLIFATMAVGLGTISEKNAEEFHRRLAWVERGGAFRRSAEGDVPFTLDEVRAHVGMTTNVSDETKTKWNKRMNVTKEAA